MISDGPIWCEGFDCDLPTVVPGAKEALGDTAEQKLWTCSRPTNGKINCPASWNEREGLVSYFGFSGPSVPASHLVSDPAMECTFWEAVRDLWVHQHILSIEKVHVWDPTFQSSVGQAFEVLMWHVRKWRPVPEDDAEKHRAIVRKSLESAADKLRFLANANKASH
jgi:hypothetical protein